jgi:hypothetical protein
MLWQVCGGHAPCWESHGRLATCGIQISNSQYVTSSQPSS